MADQTAARTEKRNYKQTLNLPKTAFPMKANLVQNEPASLERWASLAGGKGLYAALREARAGRERFVFHDGPPYANGSIHLGHLFNKCLKDFVVRTRSMMGLDAPYVPGWDCHGLPIEAKVMTDLQESGAEKELRGLDPAERKIRVRNACEAYARKYVQLQAGQMRRLLTLADYEHPYLTMAPEYEAAVLEVLGELCERGLVYRALKPVHWSIANETALAEAELEYQDREDLSVYVDFEAEDTDAVYDAFGLPPASEDEDEEGGRPGARPSFMIWTTTPWTLPANLAIAVHRDFEYVLAKIDGNYTVLASELLEKVAKLGGAEEVERLATCRGEKLLGLKYRHPFRDQPPTVGPVYVVVHAEYVTLEDGTGLVHTAPGHGTEDYQTGLREGLEIYCPVQANGTYDESVPEWLRGQHIWKANEAIANRLEESGHLFHKSRFLHSYPHDWRSKTPVIFRATEQWFVSVDRPFRAPTDGGGAEHGFGLRDRALAAIGADDERAAPVSRVRSEKPVDFVPAWGRNRFRGMIESRPDWCISRQRAWGLPIPAFTMPDGRPLMTAASVRAVAATVREHGSDAWFTMSPAELLKGYDPKADAEAPQGLDVSKLEKGGDILDVWFESGSSWNAVMRQRSGGRDYPAQLYLEGSDQHRGWFQLSLLPALGATGRAPFETILTHGFMVDKEGRKLSKSKGHTIENLFERYGADVLRWWVSSLAYENDVKVDDEFFNQAGESYRKVRNTLRFMLSNLYDAPAAGEPSFAPESLEAWVLGEFEALRAKVVAAYERYDFRTAHLALYDFCNDTLSATYLSAIKDRLYCDRPESPRRRAAQAAMRRMTDGLCRLLAPILCHTADEAYRELHAGDEQACVHLAEFPAASGVARSDAWTAAMRWREEAQQAVEKARAENKAAGSGFENPLDAGLVCGDRDGALSGFDRADLADLVGVSRVEFSGPGKEIQVRDLTGEPRCERSWKRDGTVKERADGGMLTDRDAEAVGVA